MPPRQKRKGKAKPGQTTIAQPEPPAVEPQGPVLQVPVSQAEPDLPPPELQEEPQLQPAEQNDPELDDVEGAAVKKRKLFTALTPEQEEEMVEWLAEHPVLWNKKMKDYKDIHMKDALWREQAGKMDKDINELKVWYKSLRTRYGRLRKMPSGSGVQELSDRDRWILQKLEFLRPHIVDVPKRTTVSVSICQTCKTAKKGPKN
ncbi:MAG: hypothetical protein AB2693_35045 [Candidatus Thiodiazotropha sp.]